MSASALIAEQVDTTEPVLDSQRTTCCVVGGGPGGMMLALLLARQGVPVTVLEAHKDFDREFRGDTPVLRDVPARLVAFGIRRAHVSKMIQES